MNNIKMLLSLILMLGLGGTFPTGAAVEMTQKDRAFIDAVNWDRLEAIPVLNYDLVVSMRTLAEDRVETVTGARRYEDAPAVYTFFSFIFEPEQWESAKLFKIRIKAIRNIFDGKYASLADFKDAAKQRRVGAWVDQASTEKGKENRDKDYNKLTGSAVALMGAAEDLKIIPTMNLKGEMTGWLSPMEVMQMPADERARYADVLSAYGDVKAAFVARDATAFEEALARMADAAVQSGAAEVIDYDLVNFDLTMRRLRPLNIAIWIYALSAVLFALTLIGKFRKNRALWIVAVVVLTLGLVTHCWGIGARWIIADRVPLSNLYESLIFAVAGLAAIAIGFEIATKRIYCGLGGAVFGALFCGMGNAMGIASTRPKNMMAALQSYWLHLHVSIIMLSYSAFALSFFICIVYLFHYLRPGADLKAAAAETDRKAARKAAKGKGRSAEELEADQAVREQIAAKAEERRELLTFLERLNFRVIVIGFPLLTVGIILGAVWAHTAWSRFWGWDPKEVWAAITWMIYAFYFHLRIIYHKRPLLMIVLALLGFLAVLVTYFGVSYLQIFSGLHSYA